MNMRLFVVGNAFCVSTTVCESTRSFTGSEEKKSENLSHQLSDSGARSTSSLELTPNSAFHLRNFVSSDGQTDE